MTAAEKARELVNKFRSIDMWDSENPRSECNRSLDMKYAKQCAIIAVEEVLSEMDKVSGYNLEYENEEGYQCADRKPFWQEVKEEIQKL